MLIIALFSEINYCLKKKRVILGHQKCISMEDKKDLNRIKVMLAEKKKTNKWLASAVGVNAATVSKWCTNSSQPSLETLIKIAELLEVNYTELIRVKPKA